MEANAVDGTIVTLQQETQRGLIGLWDGWGGEGQKEMDGYAARWNFTWREKLDIGKDWSEALQGKNIENVVWVWALYSENQVFQQKELRMRELSVVCVDLVFKEAAAGVHAPNLLNRYKNKYEKMPQTFWCFVRFDFL